LKAIYHPVYFRAGVNSSVYQTVARGGTRVVSEEKNIAKIISDTERMKNTPIHVCVKTAFVG
jgi:hypothetical protein